MNVQVLTDPSGRLLRASPALPGSTHDLTAARQHGIMKALAEAGLKCWAAKAYQGAGGTVRVPFRGRRPKRWKRRHNTTHAKIRCLGEQSMAPLKAGSLHERDRSGSSGSGVTCRHVPVWVGVSSESSAGTAVGDHVVVEDP